MRPLKLNFLDSSSGSPPAWRPGRRLTPPRARPPSSWWPWWASVWFSSTFAGTCSPWRSPGFGWSGPDDLWSDPWGEKGTMLDLRSRAELLKRYKFSSLLTNVFPPFFKWTCGNIRAAWVQENISKSFIYYYKCVIWLNSNRLVSLKMVTFILGYLWRDKLVKFMVSTN